MIKTLLRIFVFLPLLLSAQPAQKGQWLAPACKPKLYGLQDDQGTTVLDAKYDFLAAQDNNAWIALSGGKYGVINSKGEWLIRPQFLSIRQYKNGRAVAAKKVPVHTLDEYKESYNFNAYMGDSAVRYGIVDESSVWVVDAAFNSLEIGDDGTLLYRDNNTSLYGYLNPDGSILVPAQFVFATPMSSGAAVIGERTPVSGRRNYYYDYSDDFRAGNYFVIDRNGKKLTTQPYEFIRSFSEGRAAYNTGGLWKNDRYNGEQKLAGGKWGFLDASGNPLIPATYDYVYDFENGKAKVRLGDRTFWIDLSGKETTPPAASSVTTTLNVFCEPGSFGYIDLKGNWIIQPQFYAAHPFSEGLAAVMALRASDLDCENPELDRSYLTDEDAAYRLRLLRMGIRHREEDGEAWQPTRPLRRLFGYIDATGNTVIAAKYEVAMPFNGNRAYVRFRGKWGVIDKKGNWIMAPVLDQPDHMSSAYGYETDYLSESDDLSERSRNYDEPMETDIYYFSEGMGAISYNGKFGFIDSTGKVIVAPVYDNVGAFSQGLAPVRHLDRWGYVDKTGKEVIAIHFRSASSFTENGLALVETSMPESGLSSPEPGLEYEDNETSYFGYIDRNGKWAIRPQFSYATDFSEGLAVASVDYGPKGFIDKSGKFIIQPKYDYANNFHHGVAYVHLRMYEGFYIDKTGKTSKVFTTDHPPLENDLPLRVDIGDYRRYGYANEKKEVVIPHQYRYAGKFAFVNS